MDLSAEQQAIVLELYNVEKQNLMSVVRTMMHRFKLTHRDAYPPVSAFLKSGGHMRHGVGRVFCKSFAWKKKPCDACDKIFQPTGRSQRFCGACREDSRHLLTMYGITAADHESMIQSQENKCAICRRDLATLDKKNVHLDHCHQTGRVRGILCSQCNWRLGAIDPDDGWLVKAQEYMTWTGIEPRCECIVTRSIVNLKKESSTVKD